MKKLFQIVLITMTAFFAKAQNDSFPNNNKYTWLKNQTFEKTIFLKGIDGAGDRMLILKPGGKVDTMAIPSGGGGVTYWDTTIAGGDTNLIQKFSGNVGIGTTTPEVKLHVSISDTSGKAIAHFENNSDHALMTLHSHADSSSAIFFLTGAYSAGIGLEGVTKELRILNGLGSVAIEIDTNNNVTMPDLAGSAQKIVTADATGVLDTASFSDLRPYLVYTALLTQSDTLAPVATVLENTLGAIPVWSYSSPGKYNLTLAGKFLFDKTVIILGATYDPEVGYSYGAYANDPDYVQLISVASDDIATDGTILLLPIEIRVYP